MLHTNGEPPITTNSHHPLTRRSALTAAAACLPAIVATQPALATEPPPGLSLPDSARFIHALVAAENQCSYPELAREFAAIYARWKIETDADDKRSDHLNECLAAEGISRVDPERNWAENPTPEQKAWRDKWEAALVKHNAVYAEEPDDEEGMNPRWTPINRRIHTVCMQILGLPAYSLADLGLQAQAAALLHYECWYTDYENPLCPEVGLRLLADSLCKFAGVEPLPGYVPRCFLRRRGRNRLGGMTANVSDRGTQLAAGAWPLKVLREAMMLVPRGGQ